MINILELRPNPSSKSNGIDKYCNALRNLFEGDCEIRILPVVNYPMVKGGVLKDRYEKSALSSLFDDNIDIIHINGFASFAVIQSFFNAIKAKKKIVYTAHWHPFDFLNHPFRAKVFFYLFLRPLVKRYAEAVVTINYEDTLFFKRFHHNVIQIPHWNDSNNENKESIKKESSMVLFVGRFNDTNKGSEHLFYLPEGKYSIHCVGIYSGGKRSDMIIHENIPSEELIDLYKKASLLVVPSRYEAFSYAALEALSYGTPVLLSERVRIADYLSGVKGVYTFKYHDYNDFCEKVSSCCNTSVDINRIMDIFSKKKIKDKYRELFLTIGR